jgi:hypothetical protein
MHIKVVSEKNMISGITVYCVSGVLNFNLLFLLHDEEAEFLLHAELQYTRNPAVKYM